MNSVLGSKTPPSVPSKGSSSEVDIADPLQVQASLQGCFFMALRFVSAFQVLKLGVHVDVLLKCFDFDHHSLTNSVCTISNIPEV